MPQTASPVLVTVERPAIRRRTFTQAGGFLENVMDKQYAGNNIETGALEIAKVICTSGSGCIHAKTSADAAGVDFVGDFAYGFIAGAEFALREVMSGRLKIDILEIDNDQTETP